VPGENGSDDAEAVIRADLGTSRAVIDVAKHQGLASLSGFPFDVRTSASTRKQAGRLADRCARAHSYLGETLAFRPQHALVVLDWGRLVRARVEPPVRHAVLQRRQPLPGRRAVRPRRPARGGGSFCSSPRSRGTRPGLRDRCRPPGTFRRPARRARAGARLPRRCSLRIPAVVADGALRQHGAVCLRGRQRTRSEVVFRDASPGCVGERTAQAGRRSPMSGTSSASR
jgi:hypothetical protein